MARLRLGPVTAGLVLMLSMLATPGARADRAYSARYATTDRGQVTLVANALESCPSTLSTCAAARNGTATPSDNAWFPMGFVDVDSDSSTFNSSRASLALPSGATVLWAGLYWAADTSAGAFGSAAPAPTSRGAVRFATPAASYGVVNAATVDSDATWATRYQGFADVTSQVRAAGNGTYAVANVQAGTGSNRWAGWSLVVAYRDATQPVRRLQVYDGLQTLQPGGSTSLDVPLGGFLTPATGTVRGRLALLSWEGDRGIVGDSATLGARALSDAVSPADDVFNSTIARDGAPVTTRNPAYLNAMSLDADELSIDGVLGNAATTSILHLTTGGDTFLPGAIALATDEGPPVVRTPPTINGTSRDGSTLTADRGTWDGTPTVTYAYRWRRCASDGTSCSDLAGATGAAYAASPDDVGSTLRVVVTATNDAGSTSATSSPTAVVQAAPPVNTAAPTVSGTARDGATLTLDRGTWTGTPTIAYAFQWRRCAAGGASCSDIAGATGTSYALTSADVGSTIRAVVTATNAGGSNSATTAQTASVAPTAPANTAAPTISGTMRDGSTLTAASGSWSGTTPLTYAYQWRRCGPDGTGCTDIAGATGAAYTLVGADVGHALRVVVTAANAAGSASATSAPTATVIPVPPASNAAPVISGTARDGQAMTVSSEGGWTGTQPIAFAHQWRRCNSAGTDCSDIAGATGTTYVLTSADVGFTVRARVTASNAGGSASADSAPSATVAAAPPVNTTAPTITGTARQGETVTAQPGTWSGTPPLSYSYQWQRCDLSGANCADIAGATGQAYTLTVADVAGRVRVRVTATNAGGAASAFSAPASVNPAAPANTAPPTISGTARDGQTLTVDDGTWSGTPPFTFTHQWLRCDATGASCATVPGATGTAYTLVSADVGSTMRVAVTATNSAGSAQSTSAPTAKVAGNPPASSTPPTITGTARDGLTLTADHGSWSGSTPLSYAYRWQRCDAGGSGCADISGATQTTYTLAADDVDHALRVVVTASNSAGSTSASSAPTPRVAAQPPTSTTAPSVSGTARDGATLTADRGTWTGTAPLSYAYQWQRCDATGSGCADIAGATDASYDLASADVGHAVRVVVTATNAGGAADAASEPSGPVSALTPANTTPPAISGTAHGGETLTASQGEWTGTLPIAYAYQWRRCDADGSGCADIAGATATTYTVTSADADHAVRVLVTASNVAGHSSAISEPTDSVVAKPGNETAPSIAGNARDGAVLTADHGEWGGSQPIDYAYQWQRCDAAGTSCSDVSGATRADYELTSADVGHAIVVVVTASNAGGRDAAISAPTSAVAAAAPRAAGAPTVTGTVQTGGTLTASEGTWDGTAPMTYAYQWQRCDADGSACVDIAGADARAYTPGESDVGHTLVIVVTATNQAGSASQASSPSARVTPGASTPTPTATPTPTPTPAPPAPAGSAGGPPAAVDLSTLPGSLLTNGTCQTPTTPSRTRSLEVAGVGTVRVRVASGSVVVPEAPLQVMIAAPRGRTLKASATLDRRRLRLAGRNPRTAEVRPSQLGQPGTRMLRVRVTPPGGEARTAAMRLHFAACRAAFTARQSRAGRGTSLRLRVDSRSALSRVGFTVPAAQALRGGRVKAAVGSLRIVALGSRARTLRLTLPAHRRSGTLAASGGISVSFSRSGFTVTGLPAGTGIVQLTLAEPGSAARGGALALRATTSSASGAARLAIRIRGVRP